MVDGRTAVVTGSAGGIGREVARRLAKEGWHLVLLDRSAERQAELAAELRGAFPSCEIRCLTVDLLDTEQIAQAVAEIRAHHDRIGALWNIAGLLTDRRIVSPQETEGHFAVNAVAPYALLRGLRSLLAAGATPASPAIVVNFSTEAVTRVKALEVDALRDPPDIGGLFGAYARSKAALQAASVFLEDELRADNTFIYAVDPGATKTPMTNGNKGMPFMLRLVAPLLFKPPEKQVAKLFDALERSRKAGATGLFISGGKAKAHPAAVRDERTNAALRALLESLTGASST